MMTTWLTWATTACAGVSMPAVRGAGTKSIEVWLRWCMDHCLHLCDKPMAGLSNTPQQRPSRSTKRRSCLLPCSLSLQNRLTLRLVPSPDSQSVSQIRRLDKSSALCLRVVAKQVRDSDQLASNRSQPSPTECIPVPNRTRHPGTGFHARMERVVDLYSL